MERRPRIPHPLCGLNFCPRTDHPLHHDRCRMQVPVSRLVVVYDDLDLPTAKVRLRAKGGHGGHNGMRSIVSQLGGNKDFPRIRIGACRERWPAI